jgi:hypothetical protein
LVCHEAIPSGERPHRLHGYNGIAYLDSKLSVVACRGRRLVAFDEDGLWRACSMQVEPNHRRPVKAATSRQRGLASQPATCRPCSFAPPRGRGGLWIRHRGAGVGGQNNLARNCCAGSPHPEPRALAGLCALARRGRLVFLPPVPGWLVCCRARLAGGLAGQHHAHALPQTTPSCRRQPAGGEDIRGPLNCDIGERRWASGPLRRGGRSLQAAVPSGRERFLGPKIVGRNRRPKRAQWSAGFHLAGV